MSPISESEQRRLTSTLLNKGSDGTLLRLGYVTVNGTSVCFQLHGLPDATSRIVFVPGLSMSMYAWREQVEYFVQRKCECLLFDMRGFGLSTPSFNRRYSTALFAQDVYALLQHVGWLDAESPRIHVVGLSMGGMVVLELLIGPHIGLLGLVSTCARLGGKSKLTTRQKLDRVLNVLKPKGSIEKQSRTTVDNLFVNKAWLDSRADAYPDYATNRERMYAQFYERSNILPPVSTLAVWNSALACLFHRVSNKDLETIASSVYAVRIFTGDRDTIVSPERSHDIYAAMTCNHPEWADERVKLTEFPDVGHAAILEAGDAINVSLAEGIKYAQTRLEAAAE